MEELRRNTLVGIFMVVGLIALAWLMTSFGELPALLGSAEHDLVIQVERDAYLSERRADRACHGASVQGSASSGRGGGDHRSGEG